MTIHATEFRPPIPIGRPLTDKELREQLAALRRNLCDELTYLAGIIINAGILTKVPRKIQEMTGMRVDELEAMETRACLGQASGTAAPRPMTTEQQLDEVRTIEWLLRMHLAAMRDVTEESPRQRPIEAEGPFRSFLELHDVIVREMRRGLSNLKDTPAVENAKGFAEFWQEVVIPHAQAEDRVLWPVAKSLGVQGLSSSVDSLETEHREIDGLVEIYVRTVHRLERGEAKPEDVLRAAQAVRGIVELHFGKEEESVLRPMQPLLADEDFRPVVAEQVRAIGTWLRAHGWRADTTAPS